MPLFFPDRKVALIPASAGGGFEREGRGTFLCAMTEEKKLPTHEVRSRIDLSGKEHDHLWRLLDTGEKVPHIVRRSILKKLFEGSYGAEIKRRANGKRV